MITTSTQTNSKRKLRVAASGLAAAAVASLAIGGSAASAAPVEWSTFQSSGSPTVAKSAQASSCIGGIAAPDVDSSNTYARGIGMVKGCAGSVFVLQLVGQSGPKSFDKVLASATFQIGSSAQFMLATASARCNYRPGTDPLWTRALFYGERTWHYSKPVVPSCR